MDNNARKKYLYLFIGCIVLIILVIDATFAYFSASASDNSTVSGNTEAVTFGLAVDRATKVDLIDGLIPMHDEMAPYAAIGGCVDDNGNAVCQVYKITVKGDSNTVMFLDGYITMETKEGVDVSFTRVEIDNGFDDNSGDKENVQDENINNENTEIIKFKVPDNFDVGSMVKNGVKKSSLELFDREEDIDCLIVSDDKIGGDNDLINTYYVMVWLKDTGISQDDIQGMQFAYRGTVTFVTADGNEISASFD